MELDVISLGHALRQAALQHAAGYLLLVLQPSWDLSPGPSQGRVRTAAEQGPNPAGFCLGWLICSKHC